MAVEVREERADANTLAAYGTVSIAFVVKSRLRAQALANGLGGWSIVEELVATPWTKNYDQMEHPSLWAEVFDTTNWAALAAYDGSERVGGAVVARETPNVHMLEGRRDLALLWDIRVDEGRRGQGIGTLLFRSAEAWATERGCTMLKVETQDINVGACNFYAAMGCELRGIHPGAYPELPDEVMLLWYKRLV